MLSNRLSGDEKSIRHYTSTPHLDIYRSNSVSHYAKNRDSNNRDGTLKSPHVVGSTFGTNAPLGTFQSTFSTFSHHKSGADIRYQDDPKIKTLGGRSTLHLENPYKVSNIDEFRIKVQDPYKSSTRPIHNHHHNHHQSQATFIPYDENELDHVPDELPDTTAVFRRLSVKYDAPQYQHYQHSTNSGSSSGGDGDYEIPDPDYDHDGSTTGSSEDLPIPEPLVLSDDSPTHHHHHRIHHGGTDSCGEEYSISISASDETASASHSSPSPTTITKISESERSKIEHALKGRKTSIYVSDSLCNLYYMSKSISPPRPNSTGSTESGQSSRSKGSSAQNWVLKYTGVPVILLDTGETKNRDKRQIQIVLAEAGTGLALWKDVIDNLTSYRVTNESVSFHTMHLSTDHTTVVGLSFDDEDTAEKFAQRIDKLTSDFANISLSGSKSKNKNKKDKIKVKPVKYVKPKKTEISQPCGFMHISSIKHGSEDPKLYTTLQNFVKNGGKSPKSDISF